MSRQEFEAHGWRVGDKIVSLTSFGWHKEREVLSVDFETQSVQVKQIIGSHRVWLFCGDFEFPENNPKSAR